MAILLLAGALAVAMTGTALAQEEEEAEPAKPFGWHGKAGGFHRGIGGEGGLEAAAEVLGLTTEELTTELWGGKTLSDLADEAGVELQAVRDAVEAAHEQALQEALDAKREAIEKAVADGKLTREQADWILEGMDKGYFDHGFGGFGGCRGRGGFRGHFGHPGGTGADGSSRFPWRMNPTTAQSDA